MNPQARKFGGKVKKYSGTTGSAVKANDGTRVWTAEEIKGPPPAKVTTAPSRTPTAKDVAAMKAAKANEDALIKTLNSPGANMKRGGKVKKMASGGFAEAFKAARKAQGAGGTFTYNGKKYSTNTKEEGIPGVKKSQDTYGTPEDADNLAMGRPRLSEMPKDLGKDYAAMPKGMSGTSKYGAKETDSDRSGTIVRQKTGGKVKKLSIGGELMKAGRSGMLGIVPKFLADDATDSMKPEAPSEEKKETYEFVQKKKGGKIKGWEGSKKDESQDKKLAKKHGMSMSKWEKSSMDKKHDSQQSMKGLKKGGYCSGGKTKTVKMASGGSVRGNGCATRGKTKGRFV